MTDPIRKRDVVVHRADPAPKPARGIVVAAFTITEHDLVGLQYTPAEPGSYVVVTWHNRKRLRIEQADDLEKVGVAERP